MTAKHKTIQIPCGYDWQSLAFLLIELDQGEVNAAANRLKEDGYLIVLSPAQLGLYNSFNAIIGHCRRYTKSSLSAVISPNLRC